MPKELSDAITFARQLEAAGARIYVNAVSGSGGRDFLLNPGDAADFLSSPDAWTARQWGVTPEQLEQWRRHDQKPQCGALTASGKRCRNRLAGNVDPDVFVTLHGDRCRVHDD